jgi:tetratricopeptide (TPR) repeat protein/predicted Ser/Thr protein kinase
MGVVYRARDEKLDRDVAIKVIHDDFASDRRFRGRLLREAKAAAAVSHSGFATVYEIGEDDGKLFIVMELLSGDTLRTCMDALSLKRALTIASAIAEALGKAHEVGIVHRDVKPENVLITKDDRVKVLDFGIARRERALEPTGVAGVDETLLSREGVVIGTPGYMSPEQALGTEVGAASDVFSLGVILYEMLAHRRPFGGKSLMEAALSVTRDEPTPLAEVTHLPVEVGALVHRCLSKEPAARPSSAELAASLGRLASEVSTGPGANTEIATRPVTLQKPRKRWSLLLLFAAAAGVGVVLGIRETGRPAPSEAVAPAVESASGTAITTLVVTGTTHADARSAYQSALADLRRADWHRAYEHLHEAIAKDPDFVLANLRLAHIEGVFGEVAKARERLRWVAARESQLDERNRAWLRGVEALQMHEPVDYGAAAKKFEDAALRWPKDAELHFMAGATHQRALNLDKAFESARRAVELDPEYADALQTVARLSLGRGEMRQASEYLDRCVAARSIDCLHDRLEMNAFAGQCERVMADAKLSEANGSTRAAHWLYAASALLSQGEPTDAAESFLDRAEKKGADTARTRWETRMARARLLALRGRFGDLQKTLEESYADATTIEYLAALTSLSASAREETNERDELLKVAERFLSKRHSAVGGYLEVPDQDPSPFFWRALARGGRISTADLEQKLQRWHGQERAVGFNAGPIWFQSQAALASTPVEARAALGSRPKSFVPMQVQPRALGWDAIGRLYRMNSEYPLAKEALTRATRSCTLLLFPIEQVRAYAELGETYEALHDSKNACAAYGQVLRWWGNAQPRSVTAERVRTRARALRC